jgi:PAS domain S-box-containing protein
MQYAEQITQKSLRQSLHLPRFNYDLRPIVPAVFYLIAYAAIDLSVDRSGLLPILGDFSMTAGLNFGLLLLHSGWSAPVVFLATLADGLWCHPLPYPVPFAMAYCLTISSVQIVASIILKRMTPGHRATLKEPRDLARFAFMGMVVSMVLAITATMQDVLLGSIQWNLWLRELGVHLTYFAAAIFCITPALVLHIGPWLKSVLHGIKTDEQLQARQLRPRGISRSQVTFVASFVCLVGLVLCLILGAGITERLYIFLLLSFPLLWVAFRRGLYGLSVAVPFIALVSAVAIQSLGQAAILMESFFSQLLLGAINASIIAAGVTQSQIKYEQMKRRDAILDAVSNAGQQLLGKSGWEKGIQEIVTRIGESTSASRVFLTEKGAPSLGGQIEDMNFYEWADSSISSKEFDKRALNLQRSQMIEEASGKLSVGQPCLLRAKSPGHNRQEKLDTFGIRSCMIIPMFIEQEWSGCLGVEQCFADRNWSQSEIDGLSKAAQILGTIFACLRTEQLFRQMTDNIEAVFWIADTDGITKQYASPGYEEIWGQTCAGLQRDPRSWVQSIHLEDRFRVTEALAKQAWGEYDERFRVQRPDGSIRWIHDRAFPIRNQSGKVIRIVGVAVDITKEKCEGEQLENAKVLLANLLNRLPSGIMVEDVARQIAHVNEAFTKILHISTPPSSLIGLDSRILSSQTSNFAERIEQVIEAGAPVLDEEIELKGRILLRSYALLSACDNGYYHFWQYQDITDSRKEEVQVKSSLKEKEALVKEIHHQAKNNLQIISSLLNMQIAEFGDPKAARKLKDSQNRIAAMALIHERLYQSSDRAKIDFAGYVRGLTGHLFRSYKVNTDAIRLGLAVAPVLLNLELAIPCGLMINELVTNALKHAFPKSGEGEIRVGFSEGENRLLKLTVRDNGIGFPENRNPEELNSLGFKLVRTLAEQLGGRVQCRNENGFFCEISIPQAKTT